MKPRRDNVRRPGLTLLELLLALGLIILVSGMMFEFYEVSLKSREAGTRQMQHSYLARLVAMSIAEEIRGANGFVKSVGPGVLGDKRFIQIQTIVLPDPNLWRRLSIKDAVPPAECDVRQVQYYLAYDEDEQFSYPDDTEADKPLGLVRREVRTLHQALIREDQAQSVTLDLVSADIKYVRFRYFDGAEWIDRWDIGQDQAGTMGNSLPQAVEITVGYRALPPPTEEEDALNQDQDPDLIPSIPEPYAPDTYTIVVRLPQADTFFGSRLMRAERRSRRGVGASGSS